MTTRTMAASDARWMDPRDMERDTTLRLPRGAVVEVERGLVLVTREGDPQDHVLEPGMGLPLGRGLAVAWALEPSRVRVRRARASETSAFWYPASAELQATAHR